MALDERLGTDRLVRGDVVVNNGLKYSLLAIVKFHLDLPLSVRLALAASECQQQYTIKVKNSQMVM